MTVSTYRLLLVRFPTPRPIRGLRCYVLHTRWTLSEARFERYYSGSQLLLFDSLHYTQEESFVKNDNRRDRFKKSWAIRTLIL